jgi:hypothetical protein
LDSFAVLFSWPINAKNVWLLRMATGEATACMSHLIAKGEVERSLGADGVAWYAIAEASGRARAGLVPAKCETRIELKKKHMDFRISEEHQQIKDAIEKVCAPFDADYWLRKDREGGCPDRPIPRGAEVRITGVTKVPLYATS